MQSLAQSLLDIITREIQADLPNLRAGQLSGDIHVKQTLLDALLQDFKRGAIKIRCEAANLLSVSVSLARVQLQIQPSAPGPTLKFRVIGKGKITLVLLLKSLGGLGLLPSCIRMEDQVLSVALRELPNLSVWRELLQYCQLQLHTEDRLLRIACVFEVPS